MDNRSTTNKIDETNESQIYDLVLTANRHRNEQMQHFRLFVVLRYERIKIRTKNHFIWPMYFQINSSMTNTFQSQGISFQLCVYVS